MVAAQPTSGRARSAPGTCLAATDSPCGGGGEPGARQSTTGSGSAHRRPGRAGGDPCRGRRGGHSRPSERPPRRAGAATAPETKCLAHGGGGADHDSSFWFRLPTCAQGALWRGGPAARPSPSCGLQATDQRAGGTWRPRGTGHWQRPTGCCRQVGAAAVSSGDGGGRLAQLPAAFPDQRARCRPPLVFALPNPPTWPGRAGLWAAGVRPVPPPLEPPCPLDPGGGRTPRPGGSVPGASPPACRRPAQYHEHITRNEASNAPKRLAAGDPSRGGREPEAGGCQRGERRTGISGRRGTARGGAAAHGDSPATRRRQ